MSRLRPLTPQAPKEYSRGGGKFMPDGTRQEILSPRVEDATKSLEAIRREKERTEREEIPETEEQGGGARRRSPLEALYNRVNNFIQQTPEDRQRNVVERYQLVKEITKQIADSPSIETQQFPPLLMEIAKDFKETREALINKLLFRAFEDKGETNDYQESMNLYAQSNLETLLSYTNTQDREQYDYFNSLKSAAKLFHTMNAKLIAGNLDQFIAVAQDLNYQHFKLMQQIRGVSEAMRLYEQKYNDYLAKHGRISTEGYEQLKEDIEDALAEMNKKGLLKSEYAQERVGADANKMEDWELQRALNVGRTFFNITFRGAEKIASGQVPRGADEKGTEGNKRYSSFPQESGVKIMNWIQWFSYRFQIADVRGGLDFLKIVKKNYVKFLKEKKRKLGKNKIEKFGGMDTEELEVGAMFGISGVYSSWRIENMAFAEIKTNIKGADGKFMSIEEWVDKNANEETIKKIKEIKDEGERRKTYFKVLKPLIDNTDLGLGILLKHGLFTGDIGEIAYEARKAVWEKVSQNNLPTIINYLTGLKIHHGGEQIQSIEEIIRNEKVFLGRDWMKEKKVEAATKAEKTTTEWEILKEKIFLSHERQVKLAMDPDRKDIPEIIFSNEEQQLMNKIKTEGKKLAPHLADIVFPYIPFMNDVPFEILNYAGPGNEFYNRRNGDIASFNKAEQAFTSIMNNPGGLGIEDGLKQFSQITEGIASPQGTGDAQERVYPMFEAWIDWIMTTPGKRFEAYKEIKKSRLQPTSIAQKWSGMEALSLNEKHLRDVLEGAVKTGIMNVEFMEELKKKKKLGGIIGVFWAFIRDNWPAFLIGGGMEFGKASTKEK